MKFIQVTNLSGDPIFINPQHIGHMYGSEEKIEYGKVSKPRHTRIGVVTHNNGGFEVKETPQEIMKKINS
jgi:uncharacterized protein YlzI (FlbEa/FlbD family)